MTILSYGMHMERRYSVKIVIHSIYSSFTDADFNNYTGQELKYSSSYR